MELLGGTEKRIVLKLQKKRKGKRKIEGRRVGYNERRINV